jgi:hemerythrin-like domain-containing protein
MNTHPPLKRDPALVRYSRDHHFALLCVWKIRDGIKKSVTPERIIRYVIYFFDTDLRQHLREEEEKVFLLLPADNAMRLEAEEEHNKIYRLIEELREAEAGYFTLESFANALENYIHFEERKLFTYLQQVLSPKALEQISETTTATLREPEDLWSDAFWK